jgi:hypothetical protein
LDTPSCEAIEISSLCNLSVFSSKASSQHDEGTGVAPGGSSSASIGKLWPGIDSWMKLVVRVPPVEVIMVVPQRSWLGGLR